MEATESETIVGLIRVSMGPPAPAGRFDLDDYIDTLIGIFRFFEGDVQRKRAAGSRFSSMTAVAARTGIAERRATAGGILFFWHRPRAEHGHFAPESS